MPPTVLDAVRDAGYAAVQFNMACVGLPPCPTRSRRGAADERSPLPRRPAWSIAARLGHLQHDPSRPGGAGGRACAGSACSLPRRAADGHRPRDAVHRHARPRRPVARVIRTTPRPRHGATCSPEMERRVAVAERHGVDLGIEPELANVVTSAAGRERLIDEMGSPAAAHRARPGQPLRARGPGRGARGRRGGDRPARRPDRHGPCQGPRRRRRLRDGRHRASSTSPTSSARLRAAGFDGALVTHGLPAAEAKATAAFLADILAEASGA